MSAAILINPAKWRLCVSDPAISQLAHPLKSDAAVGPAHGTTHLLPLSPGLTRPACHEHQAKKK